MVKNTLKAWLSALIGAAILHTSPAYSLIRGHYQGSAQINVTSSEYAAYLNVMTGWGMANTGTDKDSPSLIQANGLPIDTGSLTHDISGNINFNTTSSGYFGGSNQWKISWTGTGAFVLPYGTGSITQISCSATCTIGASNTTLSGTNLSFVFTLSVGHGNINNAKFPASSVFSGMDNMRFCRVGNATPDDCTRLANGEAISQDFVAVLKQLHPRTIRTMKWDGVDTPTNSAPLVNLKYRKKQNYIGGGSGANFYAGPAIWGGATTDSGGNAFVTTNGFTDQPASWPAFDLGSGSSVVWQTIFATSNTTTADPTISVPGISGGAAKHMVDAYGSAFTTTNVIATDRAVTLIYNPTLDRVVYVQGGFIDETPMESRMELVNKVGANWWMTIPRLYSDADISTIIGMAKSTISNGLIVELDNEIFNPGPTVTPFMSAQAAAAGIINQLPCANTSDPCTGFMSWAAQRYLTVFSLATAAWSPRPTRDAQNHCILCRAITNQLSSSTAATSQAYRLNGGLLSGATLTISGISASASTPTVTCSNGLNGCGYIAGQKLVLTVSGTGNIGALNGTAVYVSPTGRATNAFQLSSSGNSNVPIDTSGGTFSSGSSKTYWASASGLNQPDHSTYPNRPIDSADILSYAPYFWGAIMTWGGGANWGTTSTSYAASDLQDCTVAGTNSGGLVCAANNYANGFTDAAFQWVDNDVRRGTINGNSMSVTLACLAANSDATCVGASNPNDYITWENIAASYDSGRTYPLEVSSYEGGYSGTWASATDCTNIKLLSTSTPPFAGSTWSTGAACSTAIQNLLLGYRASSYNTQLQIDHFRQFIGADPTTPTYNLLTHSRTPSQFQLEGTPVIAAAPWGLMSGNIYATPYFGSFNGFAAFVGR